MTLDEAFALLERTAAAGERCPMGKPYGPLNGSAIRDLIRAGKIRSDVTGHNWRVVTIIVGPHAGKSTMANPFVNLGGQARKSVGPSKPRDYSGGV